MVRLTCWLPLLHVIFILTRADAVCDQCSELQNEIAGVRKLNHRNELLLGQCYVSGYYIIRVSSLNTVICSLMLCEWLLYSFYNLLTVHHVMILGK